MQTATSVLIDEEIENCAWELELSEYQLRLMVGDLTATERRLVRRVLTSLAWRIRQRKQAVLQELSDLGQEIEADIN